MFDARDAKCREVDPELFFEHEMSVFHYSTLLKLCSNCPVFVKCSDYSLKHDVYGFWAGRTRKERIRIQKDRQINPIGLNITIEETREVG